jgi:hypothetical protein
LVARIVRYSTAHDVVQLTVAEDLSPGGLGWRRKKFKFCSKKEAKECDRILQQWMDQWGPRPSVAPVASTGADAATAAAVPREFGDRETREKLQDEFEDLERTWTERRKAKSDREEEFRRQSREESRSAADQNGIIDAVQDVTKLYAEGCEAIKEEFKRIPKVLRWIEEKLLLRYIQKLPTMFVERNCMTPEAMRQLVVPSSDKARERHDAEQRMKCFQEVMDICDKTYT